LMTCTIRTAHRGFLGGLKVEDTVTVWDCVFREAVKFQDGFELRDIMNFDEKLSSLSSNEIRVLRELAKRDNTIQNLVPETKLSEGEVRNAVTSLVKKSLIVNAGNVGRASLYRPVLKLEGLELKSIRTELPVLENAVPDPAFRKQNPLMDEEFIRNIVKGYFEDSEIAESREFTMPFFIVLLRHRKQGTLRVLRINGATGSCSELAEWKAKLVVR